MANNFDYVTNDECPTNAIAECNILRECEKYETESHVVPERRKRYEH